MRPQKLIMQAFGPFASRVEIDFDKLGKSNIYLISGVTGSGKTTIFDAICYALFNTSSGSNRGNETLRSHFAKDEVESFVEFSFIFNNEKYKVVRFPSYERLKKRGDGSKQEKSRACLYLPDGKIIEKTTEVTNYIEELLGLDVSQFSQIALLAQGEFLKLLNAQTEQRASVFRNIFKTWNYLDFQDELKNNMLSFKKEYDNIYNLILQNIKDVVAFEDNLVQIQQNYVSNNCFEGLSEFIGLLKKQNSFDNKELGSYEKQIDNLNARIKSLQDEYQKIELKLKLLKQIEKINSEIEIKNSEFKIIQAEFKTLKDKRCTLEELAFEIKKAQDDYKKSLEIKDLIGINDKLEKDLLNAKNLLDKYSVELFEVKKNYIQSLQNNYLDNILKTNELKEEFLELEKNSNNQALNYQNAYNDYLKMQAGIIASTLKEGEFCPVCGSIEHPKLAKIKNKELTKEYIDKLKLELDNLNLALAQKSSEIFVLNEKNSNILKDIYSLSKKFKIEAQKDRIFVEEKDFEAEISSSEEKIEKQKIEINRLQQDLKVAQSKIETLLKEVKTNDVDLILTQFDVLTKKYDEQKILIEQIEKNYEQNNAQLCALKSNKELLNKQLIEYKDFDVLKINNLSKTISDFALEIENINNSIKKTYSRLSINEKILASIVEKNSNFISISKKYLDYKILSDCANGSLKGKIRLAFEQYIQGYYLDLVLFEANKHLKTMTNGQFQIFRKKDTSSIQSKTGLELEVMDFYTYKKRSTKTLSGGESFKAALALALGLSDCVSNFSGAINIDAMFIDEGFGSLDSESLDLAMDVIFNLSSNNRLIGLISHVDDLKLKIQNQIQTFKSEFGSKIEVNF